MELLKRACLGDLDGVKMSIQQGFHVDAMNRYDETALYFACEYGHSKVAKYLLDNGASVNLGAKSLIAAVRYNHYDCVKLLLEYNADANCTNTLQESPMSIALQRHHYSIILLLLQYDAIPPTSLSDIVSQLLQNAKAEHAKAIQKLIDEHFINLTHKCTFLAAFHFAFKHGSLELAERILSKITYSKMEQLFLDAAYYSATPERETATTCCSLFDHFGYDSPQSAMPLLCTAATNGSGTMVKLLLKYGADVNEVKNEGNTALHLATSTAVIETLLNAGANVNARNDIGQTALSAVCENQQADASVVETLLKFGADPNINFPLHIACKNNDPVVVHLLLAYGADANQMKNSMSKRTATISDLRAVACSSSRLEDIEPSPLCIACRNGNEAIVDCLLMNGADVAFADSEGNTPLHFAIDRLGEETDLEEYDPIITLLLNHNAPVNAESHKGGTPLYVACSKDLAGVVKQLLDCKGDVGLTTGSNTR